MLTDNLPTAWYGARRAGVEAGDTVVVVGLGPVGLCAVQSAFAMGAEAYRLFAAREDGVRKVVFDPSR